MTKTRTRRTNATLYVSVVVLLTLAASCIELRWRNIFACQASPTSDDYVAYCDAKHYGDYDHGAFWYALEPTIGSSVRKAEVLFLGNSRMQWAFSGTNTTDWFSAARARYYLLGFAYAENYRFEGDLLRKFASRPKAYVIDLDGFFLPSVSGPAQLVMAGGDTLRRYQDKQFRQRVQELVCRKLARLCGHLFTFFRSRTTGQWARDGGRFDAVPTSEVETVDEAQVTQQTTAGAGFLSGLGVPRECVIFTMVPTVNTRYAEAAVIASRLHVQLVAPRLDGLRTYDGSHLDSASAARWSRDFYRSAGPAIARCLAQPAQQVARSGSSSALSRTYAGARGH